MNNPTSAHKIDSGLVNDAVKQQTQNYIGELLATANATQKKPVQYNDVQDIGLISIVAPVIREHVKVWMDQNLASLVNDIVKTEIKRLLPDEYK
jgi:cell pole-organizing protein PopZ